MSTKQAREGFPDVTQDEADAVQRLRETELFLENPVWKTVNEDLRNTYLGLLIECPLKDDLQRVRLQIALQVIDMVENHVTAAHNHARSDVEKLTKAVKRAVRTSKNPFWR